MYQRFFPEYLLPGSFGPWSIDQGSVDQPFFGEPLPRVLPWPLYGVPLHPLAASGQSTPPNASASA